MKVSISMYKYPEPAFAGHVSSILFKRSLHVLTALPI